MSAEEFKDLWMVCYDSIECAYAVISGSEWIKRDREDWLKQRMPARLLLDTATSESAATERLKVMCRERCSEAVAA